jgi:hypothetical protein
MAGSGLILRSTLALRARTLPVEGVVLAVNDGRAADGSVFYRGIVEWTGPDGRTRQTSTYSDRLGETQRGAKVALLYDPEDPETPASSDLRTRWSAVAVLGFIGAVFATIAVRVAIRARGAAG